MKTAPQYLARLAFNSSGWVHPSKDASAKESGKSYRRENGFGHEDWLFRSEWVIDGWRYSFVQGVNDSRNKLIKADLPFDLRLFAMFGQGDRRYVGEIREAECLSDSQARDAMAAFKRFGWLNIMRREVAAVGGNVKALHDKQTAHHVLCMRFRQENVVRIDPAKKVRPADPTSTIKRYTLCDLDKLSARARSVGTRTRSRSLGRQQAPSTAPQTRNIASRVVQVSPEHARMQEELMKQLRREFPDARVRCEQACVDVVVRTDNETLLFEIKSNLAPLSVIREAMGQLLEYAYHPSRSYDRPIRLFIVGRQLLKGDDLHYFKQIQSKFSTPIEYRVVKI